MAATIAKRERMGEARLIELTFRYTDKLSVMAVTLFFGSAKKERAKMRGTGEFIGYLRL
jgi:hypothetical protein